MAGLRAVLPLSKRAHFGMAQGEVLAVPQVTRLRRGGARMAAVEVAELRKQVREQDVLRRNFRVTEVDTPGVGTADWHSGTVVKVEEVVAGVRVITVETECSRELVSRANAYLKPGQMAQVRIGEQVLVVPPCSPPFPRENNDSVLLKVRGDIPAGSTKLAQFLLSVIAPLQLHVTEKNAPGLYHLKRGSEVQVGPFLATGLDMRTVLFINRFSTVVIFAEGQGIAVARALIETQEGNVGSLNLGLRQQARLFYSAPRPSLIAYRQKFREWEARSVEVRTSVDTDAGEAWDGFVGSLSALWDEDDIEYAPEATAAIVCVGSDRREEMKNLMLEAGLPDKQIVLWTA